VRNISGRRAGAEATQRAVDDSTAPHTAILNLELCLSPAERRIQAQTRLMRATAKIHYGQIHLFERYAKGNFLSQIYMKISKDCKWQNKADEIGANVQ
jgi:hypothetical protein